MGKGMKYAHLQDKWIDLYENEKLTFREIGRLDGVDPKTVARTLKGLVEIRPKSKWDAYGREWFHLYKEEGYSKMDIAKKFDVFPGIVTRVLEMYGVPRRKDMSKRKYQHLVADFVDMYESGYSLAEIANHFGIDKQTVLNYLKSEGVETRELSEATRQHELNEFYFDEIDSVEKAYHLGLLFATGSTLELHNSYATQITIHEKKKPIIQPLIDVLRGEDKGIYVGNDEVIRIRFNSKHLYSKLRGYGLNKKSEMTLPKINENLFPAFVAGYIIDKSSRKGTDGELIISGSKPFLESLASQLSLVLNKDKIKISTISVNETRLSIYDKEDIEIFYEWVDVSSWS